MQTQNRLLLEEQSDQCLHCLLFHLHVFDKIPSGLASLFEFYTQQSFLCPKIEELYGIYVLMICLLALLSNNCLSCGIYCKVSKFSDARKLCCNLPKIQTKKSPNLRVFCKNGAKGIANSEDPDQTGSALFAQTYLPGKTAI